MFNPKLSAIGIAPLSSTIGIILTKKTIIYFKKIGKVDIYIHNPFKITE